MNPVAEPVWDAPLASGWIRLRAADRARPQVLDSLLAVGVLAAAIADLFEQEERGLFGVQEVPAWVVVINAAALALPLVWRRAPRSRSSASCSGSARRSGRRDWRCAAISAS